MPESLAHPNRPLVVNGEMDRAAVDRLFPGHRGVLWLKDGYEVARIINGQSVMEVWRHVSQTKLELVSRRPTPSAHDTP
jgi:hypothetical protein